MEFKGLLKVKQISNEIVKYNPVYFATVESLQPFQQNDMVDWIEANLKINYH